MIGGGLLGLEAARGLQVQGCDVTVVHLMPTLMERQLDPDGGQYLVGKMEEIGIRVLLGRTTIAVLGNGHTEGVALSDGSHLDADIVVVAAGIRPNVELARTAGLTVNRGIVVNDHMETSDPDIFAVGECVEHRGVCYGLVAPLFEQGKVLAATIAGHRGPDYIGTVQAAKLKIMGVDVFSAGDWSEQNAEPVPLRGSGARNLQEARAPGRQARRRDPRRRHVRQPSLHGVAAHRRRPRRAAAASALSPAGVRCRPRRG